MQGALTQHRQFEEGLSEQSSQFGAGPMTLGFRTRRTANTTGLWPGDWVMLDVDVIASDSHCTSMCGRDLPVCTPLPPLRSIAAPPGTSLTEKACCEATVCTQ